MKSVPSREGMDQSPRYIASSIHLLTQMVLTSPPDDHFILALPVMTSHNQRVSFLTSE